MSLIPLVLPGLALATLCAAAVPRSPASSSGTGEWLIRTWETEDGLPVGAVCCFAEDRDGLLWLSNLQGVFRLEKEHFVEVREGGRRPLREITCLKSDPDGTMWMGSLGAGLLRWRHGSVATIGTPEGLPVRSIHGILEDEQGFFWMASNRGVVRAQRKELESVADGVTSPLSCQLLDLSDGLPSVECRSQRQPVCARDASGRLWFATLKGVAMIDPARFRPNTLSPPVRIEEVVYRLNARGASGQTERRLSGDVHSLSYRLHPSMLEDLGLAEALKAECERFTRQESIPAELKLRDIPDWISTAPPATARRSWPGCR